MDVDMANPDRLQDASALHSHYTLYSLHEPFNSRCQICSAWMAHERNANSTLATTWLLEASSKVRSTKE
jgi:hypothetical protein